MYRVYGRARDLSLCLNISLQAGAPNQAFRSFQTPCLGNIFKLLYLTPKRSPFGYGHFKTFISLLQQLSFWSINKAIIFALEGHIYKRKGWILRVEYPELYKTLYFQ